MFNRYYITAENEEQNDEIHNLFIQLGYELCEDFCSFKVGSAIIACGDGSMGNLEVFDPEHNYEKINIEQLRDLVVLYRNDILDATHYQTEYPESRFYLTSDRYVYMFYNGKWISSGIYPKELSSLNDLKGEGMNTDYVRGETIDGKTAFNAWYDGETVLVKYYLNDWKEFDTQGGYSIDVFKSKNHKFMIKPKTIMIGNVEVPAPFNPKHEEKFFILNPFQEDGYEGYFYDNEDCDFIYVQFGAWRTEDEIKQVVAALRILLKGE